MRVYLFLFFFLMIPRPPTSTLFPYTPLFRSRQAHADGWFIVFDTLTLADDRLEAFYDNPNALRDYFRDIGRMVLAAEGRKNHTTKIKKNSHAKHWDYHKTPLIGRQIGRAVQQ